MLKDEITTSLENAIARGESLQKAMQTLVNAGYNMEEVKLASKDLTIGVIGSLQPEENLVQSKKLPVQFSSQQIPVPSPSVPFQPQQEQQESQNQIQLTSQLAKPKKKFPKIIIILIVILGILLAGIFFLILFGESLLKLI